MTSHHRRVRVMPFYIVNPCDYLYRPWNDFNTPANHNGSIPGDRRRGWSDRRWDGMPEQRELPGNVI